MKWDPRQPFDGRFQEDLDAIMPGLCHDLSLASELPDAQADRLIGLILERGCQCQNERNIALGREAAIKLPRQWLLERIARVAEQTLDLRNDEWEFRRLLELAATLDAELLSRLVCRGLANSSSEIMQTARDFQSQT